MLYIDLLGEIAPSTKPYAHSHTTHTSGYYFRPTGTLSFAGINVNVVTFVCLVISVGLMVDYLMHVLLNVSNPCDNLEAELSFRTVSSQT